MHHLVEVNLSLVLAIVDRSGLPPLSSQVRICESVLEKRFDLRVAAILSHRQKGISERVSLVAGIECLLFNQGLHDRRMPFPNCEMKRRGVVVLARTQLWPL